MEFTTEQTAVHAAIKSRINTAIVAYAGSGKTTTVIGGVKQLPKTDKVAIIYFNTAARKDAQAKLKGYDNVAVWTNHTVPFAAIGKEYENDGRLLGSKTRPPKRFRSKDIASLLGITDIKINDHAISAETIAQAASMTASRFVQSADKTLHAGHVPYLRAYDEIMTEVRPVILKYAREIWADKLDRRRGILPIAHDDYLKMWAIAENPATGKSSAWYFGKKYIIVDEAQDTNPVLWDVVKKHSGAAIYLIGDPYQAIYGWRGAENYMDSMDEIRSKGEAKPHQKCHLTKTWRFGGEIVTEANKWLTLAGAELPLVGNDALTSSITENMTDPDAILCRTNSGVIAAAISCAEADRTFSIGGGSDAIKSLATGALQLMQGQPSDHPDLLGFESWQQFEKFTQEDPAGSDLKTLCNLVSEHGAQAIIDLADKALPEGEAQCHVSTAHKVKGKEWPNVKVGEDFQRPTDAKGEPKEDIPEADIFLAYVTVTRAQSKLDRGSLAYIDDLT